MFSHVSMGIRLCLHRITTCHQIAILGVDRIIEFSWLLYLSFSSNENDQSLQERLSWIIAE